MEGPESVKNLIDYNPLKAIALSNVGWVDPHGLTVIIGPNSSGKTQMLKDIHERILGQSRKLVVCKDIKLERATDIDALLDVLISGGYIKRWNDENGNLYVKLATSQFGATYQSDWQLDNYTLRRHFDLGVNIDHASGQKDMFSEHFGGFFLSSLFLDRVSVSLLL